MVVQFTGGSGAASSTATQSIRSVPLVAMSAEAQKRSGWCQSAVRANQHIQHECKGRESCEEGALRGFFGCKTKRNRCGKKMHLKIGVPGCIRDNSLRHRIRTLCSPAVQRNVNNRAYRSPITIHASFMHTCVQGNIVVVSRLWERGLGIIQAYVVHKADLKDTTNSQYAIDMLPATASKLGGFPEGAIVLLRICSCPPGFPRT